ncbi:MAG: lipocalin family protein [Phaeovulum sp.]|uniref:lipocalin family protein n=1 Tax=Phaeovulum sp. TaxID=2934796 RepID=UPI002730A946|nr:lipocalin family protein [Phaeovulum sp.]MDP2064313.1 lipocalin family protein [Phaeovulum sp.]MDP3861315.1 lipocalin family protein [Phaeovulum sp.]
MSAMTRALGLSLLLFALVGCASQTVPRRDPAVRIASVMAFDAARFAGRWQVAASHVPGCAGAEMVWAAQGGGFAISGSDCTGTAPAPLLAEAWLRGPGARIEAAGKAFGGDPVWVLWVDQDYRVAVLGTPSGRWAMILARPGAARGDLMVAAREVLAFNGYDLAQLAGAR